jgi:ABC-2 type transport system ATP-binding protein
MTMSIQVNDLYFQYGDIQALQGVDLNLSGGAAGLLGPNGAGKSTLIRILLGFLKPDRGEGRVLGYDILKKQALLRRKIGYMPENDCLIPEMDAVTFTAYLGTLSGMPKQEAMKRAHEVLFYVGLEESRYRSLETYSSGMKQRLKLAQALVHDPELLFLDEPTSGLDPQGRVDILELIKDISGNKNIQVLVSSHILADIESICSYVVILDQGKTAAEGSIQELKRVDYSLYEIKILDNEEAFFRRLQAMGCKIEKTEDKVIKVYIPPEKPAQELFRIAAEEGTQIRYFIKSETSLEDLFAKTVGEE